MTSINQHKTNRKQVLQIFVVLCVMIAGMYYGPATIECDVKSGSPIDMEKAQLAKLKEKINEQIEMIQRKQYRKLQYLREFSEIEFAVALKRKNVFLSQLMVEKLENDIHDTQAEIGSLKLDMRQKKEYTRKHLRGLFKISRQPLLATVLSKESMTDIYLQLEYLRALVNQDRKYAKEYEKLINFWMEKKDLLEELKMEAVVQRQDIWPQKESLQNDLQRRETFLKELKKNPQKYGQFLNEMQECHEMLHDSIDQLECNPEGKEPNGTAPEKAFGLPVKDTLVKNKWKRWIKDRLHPASGGLEFFIPEGSEIYSIGSGVVCFADWFIGYGNIVIIDHGDHWISVYAHCSSLEVDKGDHVDSGQRIALVGDSSSMRGFTLYFELLHGDMAVSPLEVFGIGF